MAKLKGSTLIETLIALSLIVMITGLAFSLHLSLAKSNFKTLDLKAQFLAEVHITDRELYEGEIEKEGFIISKEREDFGHFEKISIRINRGDRLLYQLNKFKGKDEN